MDKQYICETKIRTAVLSTENMNTYVFHRWNGSVDIRAGEYEINIPDEDIEKVIKLLRSVAKLAWD